MRNLRHFLFAASTLLSVVLVVFSVTVAFAAMLSVMMMARIFSFRFKPVPVKTAQQRKQNPRMWNDGHGKIIDL